MRSFPSSPRLLLGNLAAALAIAITITACGGASSSSPSASGVAKHGANDPSCPVAVPGTSVTVEDTDTGAALVFVTTGDIADLRKRVATMAQMHNDEHDKMGPLPTGDETGGHDHGAHGGAMPAGGGDHAAMGHGAGGTGGEHAGHAGGMISVHSRADAGDIEGGARLAFVAGGADVGKLQGELRTHAQHLASGSCAMGSH
jgi:hypothetical protein